MRSVSPLVSSERYLGKAYSFPITDTSVLNPFVHLLSWPKHVLAFAFQVTVSSFSCSVKSQGHSRMTQGSPRGSNKRHAGLIPGLEASTFVICNLITYLFAPLSNSLDDFIFMTSTSRPLLYHPGRYVGCYHHRYPRSRLHQLRAHHVYSHHTALPVWPGFHLCTRRARHH